MSLAVRAPAFVNDLETCVGCHACAVACANENQLAPGHSWRHIVTFNEARRAGLPTFHLSIACNHCTDAPCMKYCPALAIARDVRTGAVLIDESRCIGCRYCSWVCPYEAPRFDEAAGVMRKCTLCAPRLAGGLAPACVSLCPVGALKLGPPVEEEPRGIAGFPSVGIGPSIRFLPLRARAGSQAAIGGHADPGGTVVRTAPPALAPAPESREATAGAPWAATSVADHAGHGITARAEWPLVAFTFVAQVLVGVVLGWAGGGPAMPAPALVAAGVLAMGVSLLHLGRPLRAWRAGLNWRRSWLSREVLAFSAFLGLAVAALTWPVDQRWRWTAAVTGLLCLVSIDRVYAVMARDRKPPMDQVSALTAGWLAAALWAGFAWLAAALTAWRLAAYTRRLSAGNGTRAMPASRAALARIGLGVGGFVLCALGGAWSVPLGLAVVLGAELIDRVSFYDRLDLLTPRRQMARDLAVSLNAPAR